MKKTLLLPILTVSFITYTVVTNAAGISVSPEKLDITVAADTAATKLTVANPTADVEVYSVTADDFSQGITAQPESFTLESGGRKEVVININRTALTGANGTVLATNLSVVGKPLADSKLAVATGVKIPLTLHLASTAISKNFSYWKLWPALAAIILLLALIMFLLKRKKTTKISQ